MELTQFSAVELGRRLAAKELGCIEVTQAFLDRIERLDAEFGAFLTVDAPGARAAAAHAQTMIDQGNGGPLTGVPVAVKDNMSTRGIETTCASKILKGYVPPFDATAVARLRRAGMPILGKTNLDEFAMGTSTETSAFRTTYNPWDRSRSPGGSSGGSAAAVAAELAPLALGSDTGGSIRQPAALCGGVGFKPTYGRCSRFGLVAFGSSLDQIGPMGRSVEDVARLAEAITGHDPLDCTSLDMPPVMAAGLKEGSLRGLRIALPREMFGEGTDPGVEGAVRAAVDAMIGAGADAREISIPTVSLGVTTYYIIAPAEASSNLARFDGVRFGIRSEGAGHIGVVERTRAEGFGHEVKSRIMIGTYALSAGYYDAYYSRAQSVRALMQEELARTFQDFDVVVSPTSPIPAFRIGELSKDPLALKRLDFCTIPANLGGMPAISLNCGFTRNLPVGLQLMGPHGQDERLLQVAYALERLIPAATRRPPIP